MTVDDRDERFERHIGVTSHVYLLELKVAPCDKVGRVVATENEFLPANSSRYNGEYLGPQIEMGEDEKAIYVRKHPEHVWTCLVPCVVAGFPVEKANPFGK